MTVRHAWQDWHPDPREQDIAAQAEDFCEQCGRDRNVTCPACGDDCAPTDIADRVAGP